MSAHVAVALVTKQGVQAASYCRAGMLQVVSPGAEALHAALLGAVYEGAGAPGGRASTEAAVLVLPALPLPVSLQMPGCRSQQVEALPADRQAVELWVLPLPWLIPAHACAATLTH